MKTKPAPSPYERSRLVANMSCRLNELQAMASVVETLMYGNLASAPNDYGIVELCENEATAICWMATSLCGELRQAVAAFNRDFLKGAEEGQNND